MMIGILGAYGDIGVSVMKALNRLGVSSIKCGGRNISKVSDSLKLEFPRSVWKNVDVTLRNQLLAFAEDCEVLVNCTPSYTTSEKIAEYLKGCGCKYVDVGYSESFYDMQGDSQDTVIFAAGSNPGLSMMLCRYITKYFVKVDNIKYIFGVLDVFGLGAARDYIEGISSCNNMPLSAYRNGIRTAMTAKRQPQAEVAMFPRRVELCPFSDRETDMIMNMTGVQNGTFYITLDGKFLTEELNKIRMKYSQSPDEAISDLMRVSRLEMTDKSSYIRFLIEATGETEKGRESMTLYFYNESSSQLTGSVAACVAFLAYQGKLPKGIYPCAATDNFEEVINMLTKVCDEAVFQIFPGTASSLLETNEGEI